MSAQILPRRHTVRNIPGVHYAHFRSPESRTFRRQVTLDYGLIATRWPLSPSSYRVLMWLLTQRYRRGFTHQIVADELGFTRQAITQAFAVLENHGFMRSESESVKFTENYGEADTYIQATYHTFETPLINEEYVRKCGGYVLAQEKVRAMFGNRAVDASLDDDIDKPDGGDNGEREILESLRVDADFESYAPPMPEAAFLRLETEAEAMAEIASLPYPSVSPVRYSSMRIPSSSLRRLVSRVAA
jgi:hypothetical protein